MPSLHLLSLFLAVTAFAAGVDTRPPHASRPGQNCLRAPGFAPTAPPWHLVPATRAPGAPPRATPPHAVAVPGRYAVTSPPFQSSHEANSDFPSASSSC